MLKVIYCMRRLPTLSHAEFLAHWNDVHAPMVIRDRRILRLHGYSQTVPVVHAFSPRVDRTGATGESFDGVAELTWATDEDFRHALEHPDALAIQRALASDERLFVDTKNSVRWIAQTSKRF